jgi:hypothetical protein
MAPVAAPTMGKRQRTAAVHDASRGRSRLACCGSQGSLPEKHPLDSEVAFGGENVVFHTLKMTLTDKPLAATFKLGASELILSWI